MPAGARHWLSSWPAGRWSDGAAANRRVVDRAYRWRQRASFSARSSLSSDRRQQAAAAAVAYHRGACMARHSARLRSRVFWILVAVLFGSSIAQNGAITHLAALLTDRGVTAHGAALSVSAMGAASLAGRLVTGWLLDRFFAARVAFGLLTMAALGTLLATGRLAGAWRPGGGPHWPGDGRRGGRHSVSALALFRLGAFSVLCGLTWTAYAIAGAIGPILMGRAFDVAGSYATLLPVLAGVMLMVATMMLFLPRYQAYATAIPATQP